MIIPSGVPDMRTKKQPFNLGLALGRPMPYAMQAEQVAVWIREPYRQKLDEEKSEYPIPANIRNHRPRRQEMSRYTGFVERCIFLAPGQSPEDWVVHAFGGRSTASAAKCQTIEIKSICDDNNHSYQKKRTLAISWKIESACQEIEKIRWCHAAMVALKTLTSENKRKEGNLVFEVDWIRVRLHGLSLGQKCQGNEYQIIWSSIMSR